MATGERRSGLNALSYGGIKNDAPPQLVIFYRDPTANDLIGYTIGTIWIVKGEQRIWMMILNPANTGEWVKVFPQGGSTSTTDYNADSGSAIAVSGKVNFFGGSNLNTVGSGNTIVTNIDADVDLVGNAKCGNDLTASGLIKAQDTNVGLGTLDITGTVRLDDLSNGVVSVDNSHVLGIYAGSENGQTLIGKTGDMPKFAKLTSSDGTIDIIPGPNTINLKAIGGAGGDFAYIYQAGGGSYTGNNKDVKMGSVAAFVKIYDPDDIFYPGDGAGNPAYFKAPEDGSYYIAAVIYCYSTSTGGTVLPADLEWIRGVVFETPSGNFYFKYNIYNTSSNYALWQAPSAIMLPLKTDDKVYFAIDTVQVASFTPTGYVYGYKVN